MHVSLRREGAAGDLLLSDFGLEALRRCRARAQKFPDTPVIIDHLARIGAKGPIRNEDVAALCSPSA